MKKFIFILLINQCTSLTVNSQSGWFQQTSGVTGILRSVFFFNENTGLAVGISKLRTTNGGLNWNPIK